MGIAALNPSYAYCESPHPEERALPAAHLRCPVARLEGWPRVHALRPSFETLASQAPQDEASIFFTNSEERALPAAHLRCPVARLEGWGNARISCFETALKRLLTIRTLRGAVYWLLPSFLPLRP